MADRDRERAGIFSPARVAGNLCADVAALLSDTDDQPVRNRPGIVGGD